MSAASQSLLLYVEDEVLIQDLVESALQEAGFEVALALDGEAARDVLTERRENLRGLITDVNLPGGLDGWDVARQARELMNDLPVVYVSGGSPHEWTSKGVPNSIMIEKPFAPAQIVVAISTLINAAGPQS